MSNPVIPANISKPRFIESPIIKELYDGVKLSEILEAVNNSEYSIDQIYFGRDWGYHDEPDEWTIKGKRIETPEETQIRVDEWVRIYNERMAQIDAEAERKKAQRDDKEWKEFQRLKKKFGN